MTANKIAAILRSQIFSQQYLESDKLPSERKLAEEFQVARGTVREALLQLEQAGLVKTRAGSGTYVTYSQPAHPTSAIQHTSPMELIDARFALEPQIAKLAVLNATTHDISNLQRMLERLDNAPEDRQLFSEVDESFHRSLAECTHNSLIIWMHRHLLEIRGHKQWQQMKRLTLTTGAIAAYNQHHNQILQAVHQRDAEKAVDSMRQHLHYARNALTQAAGN